MNETRPVTSDPFVPLTPAESQAQPRKSPKRSTKAEAWEPIMPAPGEPPEGAQRHRKHGTPSHCWVYRDMAGAVLFAVCRFDLAGGKEVLPLSYGVLNGHRGWHWKAPSEPRPLYGLDRLAVRPDAPVLLTEGEKAAAAAVTLFPDVVPIASQGGAQAAAKADWSALRGRNVTIWPDHDEAGARYAQDAAALIAKAGAASLRLVAVPPGWPIGWDVADALPEGVTAEGLRALLKAAADPTMRGDAAPETDDEAIARLAKLPLLEYERCREAEAERLGIKRVSILDKLVEAARNAQGDGGEAGHGRGVRLREADPWPDPVRLGDVLDDLQATVRRHIVLSADAAVVVALWIAHTHVYVRFEHTPRLAITSPTKRCGKSTLLAILAATCRRILKADNISPSGVFRTVEALHPLTLLLDEVDAFAKDNEELRGVLNAGFERTGSVIRVVERKDEHVPVQFAVFAPVALAAIGSIPGTLADRAVPLRMERKAVADKVTRLREAGAANALTMIARQLARWAADDAQRLGTDPAVPAAMNDREGDICVPLLSIADAAGGDWPTRARQALLVLFGLRAEAEDGAETGTLLLTDLRAILIGHSAERMTSAELCQHLGAMEERPWSEWRQGKPITAPQLANALRPFGIRPTTLRTGTGLAKGYYREAFEEAWSRYLAAPAIPPHGREGGSKPEHRNIVDRNTIFAKTGTVTPDRPLRPGISQDRSHDQRCYGVTASDPPPGAQGRVDDEIAL